MFYRIHVMLNLPTLPDIEEIPPIIKKACDKAFTVNAGQPQSEQSFITLERCSHDEYPCEPCHELRRWQTPA